MMQTQTTRNASQFIDSEILSLNPPPCVVAGLKTGVFSYSVIPTAEPVFSSAPHSGAPAKERRNRSNYRPPNPFL